MKIVFEDEDNNEMNCFLNDKGKVYIEYAETLRLMQLAKYEMENIFCEKCNAKPWYKITTDRNVEYKWCCKEMKQEIENNLSNIGFKTIPL